jgi:hypothetical protein
MIIKFLAGFTNTTSVKSEEKEKKMFDFKTDIPELDQENESLLKAAAYLELCGNSPGLTAADFYRAVMLKDEEMTQDEFSRLANAAIAIETMMQYDQTDEMLSEPTIH